MARDDGNLSAAIGMTQKKRVDQECANSSVFDLPGHRSAPPPANDAQTRAGRIADGGFMGRFSPWELHPGYAFEVCGRNDA